MKPIFLISFLLFSAAATAQVKTLALGRGSTTTDTYVQGSYKVDPSATKVFTHWSKVYGPTATIVTPDSLGTKILALRKGTYYFAFKVTDSVNNLSNTDYMKIIVK